MSEDNNYYFTMTTNSSGAAAQPYIYDYTIGGTNMIGGDNCHLCGSRRTHENIDRVYKKRGCVTTRKYITYKCGTTVSSKNGGSPRVVVVGKKCIPNTR